VFFLLLIDLLLLKEAVTSSLPSRFLPAKVVYFFKYMGLALVENTL